MDAVGETTKTNYGVDTRGKKENRTSKKYLDERCMSSHDMKTFISRSVVKQKGIAFGFRKMATAVTRPERQIDNIGLYTKHPQHFTSRCGLNALIHVLQNAHLSSHQHIGTANDQQIARVCQPINIIEFRALSCTIDYV
jgi:hypothetical protein